MSKKDYIKFAQMFKEQKDKALTLEAVAQITEIVKESADIFKADNPNFSRDRFLKACGVA